MTEPRLLHGFLDVAVRSHGSRTAIDVPPGRGRSTRQVLTYAELARRSDVVAALLGPVVHGECVVAILVGRGNADLYAAQIGTMKSGAAYVCIDPEFPDEHMRFLLDDSRAVALLTDSDHAARVAQLQRPAVRVIDVAALDRPTSTQTAHTSPPWLTPTSLAYVIYTSGTTGRPKGVAIEHGAISNLVASDIGEFGLTPEDRVAQGSSPAYDSSVEEEWLAFAAGATAVVMDDDAARLGPDLPAWLRDERITVLCPTPTLLRSTGCLNPEAELPDLRFVYAGGEALPQDLADRWAPGRRFVNGYGPTECSVTSLRGPVRRGERVTIGQPVQGHVAWVVDAALEEVADGEPGELCIGGAGLARGYVDRPDLTAERFPVHPRLGRIYRTGDLVRRDGSGDFHYLGRLDAQVKVRGHRIELGEIEARLAQCSGVREAACRVQAHGAGDDASQCLAAHVVPSDPASPPQIDALRAELLRTLPTHMVPDRYRVADQLPRTAGGKLDRRSLPDIAAAPRARGDAPAPCDAIDSRIAESFRIALSLAESPSLRDDFFLDLGGNSLRAAVAVSAMRLDPATSAITVRDVYEARTVSALADLARSRSAARETTAAATAPARTPTTTTHPILVTIAQAVVLAVMGSAAAILTYLLAFDVLPRLVADLGIVPLLVVWPALHLVGLATYACVTVVVTAIVKRMVVGRYRPLRVPVWSWFHLRHWVVRQFASLIPWTFLADTVFLNAALRLLGARIGRRVHIHRGADIARGGWDLLEIGDDATVGEDAALRLVDLDDGHLVIGPVTLGPGSTLDIRSSVSAHAVVGANAYLTPLSWLAPAAVIASGARWDGVPARPAGAAHDPPPIPATSTRLPPAAHGLLTILVRHARLTVPYALCSAALAWVCARWLELDDAVVVGWFSAPHATPLGLVVSVSVLSAVVPLAVLAAALFLRLTGTVRPGVIDRWSPAYLRVLVKTDAVRAAGEVLSGTLFWPIWLRLAGMRIGSKCEISTITDVVPELNEIGAETFLADGIYLGGPRVHRGSVTLARTRLGRSTFLGNHVVIPAGTQLPDRVLLGVCTVADDAIVREGTDWFGHPPMALPRREVVASDRRLTLDPSPLRWATRLFWEAARFLLPVAPAAALVAWWSALAEASATLSPGVFLFVAVPCVGAAVAAAMCALVLVMKWALLGRVRPGSHALWSCWCSRWDFHYVAWQAYARPLLARLDGTLLLAWYLRAMGSKIGRRVVLGDGFAHVVDPDMLRVEDGATVACLFQAHSFEDRVLKIDHVDLRRGCSVGSGAVVFYGADIGADARVAPHSVVMKHEHLAAGRSYVGSPIVSADDGEPAA
ncbi:MAG: amino acid adenylation domain-containing protein [Planctomycetes bacterium]|nr:amino acid adenylation domain-containing protein [Planctomycetota bacterium]